MSSGRTPASLPQLVGKRADAGLQAVAQLVVVVVAGAMRADAHARPALRRAVGPRHDDRLRARNHRHAVVARQRIGDQGRGEILLHRQRRAIDRVRILRRPFALRDGDVAVVGFLQAVFLDLAARDQRIDAVRPAVAERREMLLRRGVVVRGDLGVAGKARRVAAEHEHHVGRAGLDGAERIAEHAHAGRSRHWCPATASAATGRASRRGRRRSRARARTTPPPCRRCPSRPAPRPSAPPQPHRA